MMLFWDDQATIASLAKLELNLIRGRAGNDTTDGGTGMVTLRRRLFEFKDFENAQGT